jgi:ADP-ribosylglycohydrolase
MRKPLPDTYHPTKEKGGFTHYCEQTLILLESLARNNGFSLADFAMTWKTLFTGYHGYIDKATAATMDNMARQMPLDQCGSHSSELGGLLALPPLSFLIRTTRKNSLRLYSRIRQP